jgi:ketol-acid reductoisomerase
MNRSIRRIENRSASIHPLQGKRIVILGFGAQGSAHALNLRDSGLNIVVAQRSGSPRHAAAVQAGFQPIDFESAAAADLLIFALPDDVAPRIYREHIAPRLHRGQTLGFLHGFTIHYQQIVPPSEVDVVLVAPKAQARGVRDEFVAGRGVLSLVAVHQDASGAARSTALAWAAGIGSARAAILETTFRDETETDLFGEQAVLCGGLAALIQAGFETLVDAGYPPELAYLECCHEIKLLADLVYAGGPTYMRERISSTARFGDLTRGTRIISTASRAELRRLLDEIRSGQFARELLDDASAGGPRVAQLMNASRAAPIERVGAELRRMMWGAPRPPDADR